MNIEPGKGAVIEVGSTVSDPGKAVSVPVTLRTPGHNVAGVQHEIMVDSTLNLVSNRLNRPDCQVNPQIDKNASSFAFRPVGAQQDARRTFRALILSTDNTNAIPDDSVLYWFKVGIDKGARPSRYRLQSQGVICSDPSGGRVPATGCDGFVEVLPLLLRESFSQGQKLEQSTPSSPSLLELLQQKRRSSAHDVFLCYNNDDQPLIRERS